MVSDISSPGAGSPNILRSTADFLGHRYLARERKIQFRKFFPHPCLIMFCPRAMFWVLSSGFFACSAMSELRALRDYRDKMVAEGKIRLLKYRFVQSANLKPGCWAVGLPGLVWRCCFSLFQGLLRV